MATFLARGPSLHVIPLTLNLFPVSVLWKPISRTEGQVSFTYVAQQQFKVLHIRIKAVEQNCKIKSCRIS